MAYLKRPQRGDKVLQSLFDSVNSIIDYLPTITVRGDNYSTFVEHSTAGTVIHAKQPVFSDQAGKTVKESGGGDYYADGTTLQLNTSTNTFSIKPPSDNTKNYALVCLSGQIQWIELEDC